MAKTVKNLPATREMRVQSLGQKDLLEKEMATHSSILVWRIPWREEPGYYLECVFYYSFLLSIFPSMESNLNEARAVHVDFTAKFPVPTAPGVG